MGALAVVLRTYVSLTVTKSALVAGRSADYLCEHSAFIHIGLWIVCSSWWLVSICLSSTSVFGSSAVPCGRASASWHIVRTYALQDYGVHEDELELPSGKEATGYRSPDRVLLVFLENVRT